MIVAHQTLADYAKGKPTQEEWQKIAGRFVSGESTLSSITQGNETEELVRFDHHNSHRE